MHLRTGSVRRRWYRRGSFLLLVLGTLFCSFLFALSYHRYMLMQQRLASRTGEHRMLSKVGLALATRKLC